MDIRICFGYDELLEWKSLHARNVNVSRNAIWTSGSNKCLADGNQPEYMSKNPTQYLFPDRQACCTKHYSWSLTTCLFESDSTDLGDLQWYIDWTCQTGGTCVMNCPGDIRIVEDLRRHGILSGVARKNAARRWNSGTLRARQISDIIDGGK